MLSAREHEKQQAFQRATDDDTKKKQPSPYSNRGMVGHICTSDLTNDTIASIMTFRTIFTLYAVAGSMVHLSDYLSKSNLIAKKKGF